ncbi:type III secretion system chaperone [Pantoea sp. 18069]|uniref:type III secretion system chaperone n=1 Tax=Pantoea sp. 18069 TaxID=2681415 RepID=UPI0013575D7A|nr:type III secretion system chaperone [Pantoea sp. 18069]
MKHFAMDLGLADLALDAHGCASLCVDGQIEIHFEHDATADAIHLYSHLAPLPAEGREAFYLQLLQANLLGAHTAGATLAIDDAAQAVVLCLQITPWHCESRDFAALVERFVDAAAHWRERLAGPQPAVQAIALPQPPAGPAFFA